MTAGSSVDDSPTCLCAQTFSSLLRELITLRQCYPARHIPLSKTDFHHAFRNVRINPDYA